MLCVFGLVVLSGKCAVGRDPVLGIVRLLQRIADTSVTCSKDTVTTSGELWAIKRNVHQFVHVLEDEHVAVKLDDAFIFDKTERSKLAPAVIEARVVAVVLGQGRQQVGNALGRNAASFKSSMTFGRERVGVEGDERVLAAGGLERVVESQQAREIVGVCD